MLCKYCGFEIESGGDLCGRCGSPANITSGERAALTRQDESVECPSCSELNSSEVEYCATCGSPMAIITRVLTLSRTRAREPLESWRVYGIETSMFGRRDELQTLVKAHKRVTSKSQAETIAIAGPTGIGKSRLISEFVRTLDESMSESVVYQTEARDESASTFVMIERMLRARFYIAEREAPETSRRKLLEASERLLEGGESERVAHLVGELIGIHFDESKHLPSVRDTEDAAELDRRCFNALLELLSADAAQNPLVVVLEDLQYAPNPVFTLLDILRSGLQDCPVLFILTWNSDELPKTHPLRQKNDELAQIWLQPLSDLEVEHFVRDTLRKAEDLPSSLVERVTEAAHGNPLIVEEFLRILISQGIIDTRFEAWKVDDTRVREAELPATVEGAVEARLLALTEDERLLISMASAVGQTFWVECLHAIYHMHDDLHSDSTLYWENRELEQRINALIESLERKDMIRRSEEGPTHLTQLYFKHRIEQKSIYSRLSGQDRERYHRLIAQWQKMRLGSNSRSVLESTGEHFVKGKCLEQAAETFFLAAEKAREKYENEIAIDLLRRTLSLASDRRLELKLLGFEALGELLVWMGDHEQALEAYREFLRFAWILGDRERGARAYNDIGKAHRSLGDYDRALKNYETALGLFRDIDLIAGIATSLDNIGHIHWVRGDFEEAKTFFNAGLHLRRQTDEPKAIALSLSHIGSVLLQQGDLKSSMVYFRESLELRKAADDKQGVVDSFNNLGCLLLERGDVDGAQTLLEEALETARSIGYRGSESVVLNNLGELHLQEHRTREARQYLESAMKVAEDGGDMRVVFDILKNLSRLELRETNREKALERIHEATEIADHLQSDQLLGLAMQALAEVHAEAIFDPGLRDASIAASQTAFKEAVELFAKVGNDGERAKSLLGIGRLQAESGDIDAANLALAEAEEIFERLGMKEFAKNTRSIMS